MLSVAAQEEQAMVIDHVTYRALVDSCETQLGQTMLRKQHTLFDVQATLIMAGWGLHGDGGGPDAWVSTCTSCRLSEELVC